MTGGSRRSGCPSRSRMRHIRSSDRSMRLGCSASSRARIASTWVTSAHSDWIESECDTEARWAACPVRKTALHRFRTCSGSSYRDSRWDRQRGGRVRRGLGQQAAEFGECRPQFMTMYNHVDHAVILEILGFLETFGQFFADGLFNHTRSGKADERPGL